LIDSERERSLSLGREYPFEEIGYLECLMHEKMANLLGVNVGD
jgi:hypothetical protein